MHTTDISTDIVRLEICYTTEQHSFTPENCFYPKKSKQTHIYYTFININKRGANKIKENTINF